MSAKFIHNSGDTFQNPKDIIKAEASCISFSSVVEITRHLRHSALSDLFGITHEEHISDLYTFAHDGNDYEEYSIDWISKLLQSFNYWIPLIVFILLTLLCLMVLIRQVAICTMAISRRYNNNDIDKYYKHASNLSVSNGKIKKRF